MDMPVPNAAETHGSDQFDKLVIIAELLRCTPDTFFQPSPMPSEAETARLLQLWTKITEPTDRQVVFRCIYEVLKARNGC